MSTNGNGYHWSKFWWDDWQGDAELRTCSLAAQGLWMRLLCIAHKGTPIGHVTINGKVPTAKKLAAVVGVSEKEVTKLLAELDEAGVFSRTADGTIYNRRMEKEGKQRDAGRDAATRRWGGNGAAHPNGGPIGLPSGSRNGLAIDEAKGEAIGKPMTPEARSTEAVEAEKESKQDIDSTCFSFPCCAPAREAEAVSGGSDTSDGFVTPVEDRVDPGYVAVQLAKLTRSLRHVEHAKGRSSGLSLDEQVEVLKPSRPPASYINPELLRAMPHRQRALGAAGAR